VVVDLTAAVPRLRVTFIMRQNQRKVHP